MPDCPDNGPYPWETSVPETDKLTASLDEIRERSERGLRGWIRDRYDSADDVPRLLAAVDAVLQRHQPKPRTTVHPCPEHSIFAPAGVTISRDTRRNCPDCRYAESIACAACDPVCPDDNVWPCKDYLAISRALLGEDGQQ
jgi:hypothetical protein